MTDSIANSIIPPEIIQHYDKKLLNEFDLLTPEDLRKKYTSEVERKYKKNSLKHKKYEFYMKVYEALCEWKEASKNHKKESAKEKKKRPTLPAAELHKFKSCSRKDVSSFFRSS
mgnify:CR=1 FL=1